MTASDGQVGRFGEKTWEAEVFWTFTEERWWVYWEKDAEDRVARKENVEPSQECYQQFVNHFNMTCHSVKRENDTFSGLMNKLFVFDDSNFGLSLNRNLSIILQLFVIFQSEFATSAMATILLTLVICMFMFWTAYVTIWPMNLKIKCWQTKLWFILKNHLNN